MAEEQRGRAYRRLRAIETSLDSISDRSITVATVVVFLVLALTCFTYDATAAMWLDELHGYYVLQLGAVSRIDQALLDGVDNSAPIYLLICNALRPILGSGAFALRFPSAVGFCVACVSIHAFLLRRLPRMYALLGVLVMSGAAMYSIEGRPYGLTLGCVSAALLAWQSAADQRSRALAITCLFSLLCLAIATHYWSVFVLPALCIAELMRWRTTRRFDLPIAFAVTVPALVLLFHLEFIKAVARFMPFFWSKPFFPLDSRFMLAGIFGNLPMLAAFAIPIAVFCLKPWRTPAATLRVHEWTLVTAIAAAPYWLLIVALLTTRIFQDRYVVWSAFGITILFVALLARYAPSCTVAVIACSCVTLYTAAHWKNAFAHRHELRLGEPTVRLLAAAPATSEPIVIATHQPFMELAYYESPQIRPRLVYLDNADLERFYTNTDTGSLLMSAVRHWTTLNIQDYCGFLAHRREFLLAADAEDWLPQQLSASGYKLTPILLGWHPALYRVEAPFEVRTPIWIRAAKIHLTCSD